MRSLVPFLLALALPSLVRAQARVEPAFSTPSRPDANVDSCTVWVAPEPAESLLFVTEKEGDRVQVLEAATGREHAPRPYLGGAVDSSAPGAFDRPNGVWVIPHVPHAGGFADVLLVTEQNNERVQAFRLPGLEHFGEFGTGEVGKGYGIAWYHDGTDFFVFITDDSPPEEHPGKIKKYRLRPENDGPGADLVLATGSSDGSPPLSDVESIAADLAHDRLHVCGDEGGGFNRVFRLDGEFTGIEYGEPQFQADQEGINIYDSGGGGGYIIVADQIGDGDPTEFEVFDRDTLAPRELPEP